MSFLMTCLRACAVLVAPVAACAWASAAPPVAPANRASYLPARDDEVLQTVPAASDPALRRIAVLRARQASEPGDLAAADALARAYVDFARQQADARYAGYAEAVVAPWLAMRPPPLEALVTQATILQYRHEFAPARELLLSAVKRDGRNAQAWLSLATLDMVQGNYTRAAESCSQVSRTGGLALGIACTGSLRSYLGQAEQAYALLRTLEPGADGGTPSYKAWLQGLLAECAERLGRPDAAEKHYRSALAQAPRDNFLLVAYADLLLDRGRPREVIDLLAPFAEADTAFLRLTLAHAALASPEAPTYAWLMAARFAAYAQRGTDLYGREEVRFALHVQHDPQSALALAQRNWQVQRAPWDARVLLEAAVAARDPRAAASVVAFVRETRLQDPAVEALVRRLETRPANVRASAQ